MNDRGRLHACDARCATRAMACARGAAVFSNPSSGWASSRGTQLAWPAAERGSVHHARAALAASTVAFRRKETFHV